MPKVDEIDFNGNSVAVETGQTKKTETKEEVKTPEETDKVETEEVKTEEVKEDVESLPQWAKERLKKSEKEKEEYKSGMNKYKYLTLEKKVEESKEEEIEYPEWDDNSKKFQEQTLSQAEKRAEEQARKIVEKYNEKVAISQFVERNPELAEEDKWKEVISNYHPRSGKETPQDILNDLEESLIVTRYRKGELNDLEAKAEEKGNKKGKAEAQIIDLSSVSKTTSKTVKEGNTLSPGAIDLANKMRVDLKKLAEEDLSIPAEIKL